jgi:hypothetical protein
MKRARAFSSGELSAQSSFLLATSGALCSAPGTDRSMTLGFHSSLCKSYRNLNVCILASEFLVVFTKLDPCKKEVTSRD